MHASLHGHPVTNLGESRLHVHSSNVTMPGHSLPQEPTIAERARPSGTGAVQDTQHLLMGSRGGQCDESRTSGSRVFFHAGIWPLPLMICTESFIQ